MNQTNIKVNILRSFRELRLFYMLAGLVFISFVFYVFFIGQTVFRLVESKGLESEKRTLAAEISELELQTLSLNDTISIDKAYELGFVDAPDTQFVTQKAVVTIR